MRYQEELFCDVIEELKPLLVKHWEELANNKDQRPLDVDYDTYFELNRMQFVRMLTARDGDNLVGYFIFTIAPNLHYKTWSHANVDIYWIDPAYRGLGNGVEMMREVEVWLKSLGVRLVTMMDKVKQSHEKFFTYLGYSKVEQLYEKII